MTDQPHQHAFFVVGTERLFLVHMGNMWMAPHRYQLVLEISLPERVKKTLLADRANGSPNDWHIIGNEAVNPFPIPLLAHRQTKFVGSLWRNFPTAPNPPEHWPWGNDPKVADSFDVTVLRTVYFRHLDFSFEYPPTASYVLFGGDKEAHIHHVVTRQPDFDHVATLKSPPVWLPPVLLESGVAINFLDIPQRPAGADFYKENPVADGKHAVGYGGDQQRHLIEVAHTVFFGTYPLNDPNTWPPGGKDTASTAEGAPKNAPSK